MVISSCGFCLLAITVDPFLSHPDSIHPFFQPFFFFPSPTLHCPHHPLLFFSHHLSLIQSHTRLSHPHLHPSSSQASFFSPIPHPPSFVPDPSPILSDSPSNLIRHLLILHYLRSHSPIPLSPALPFTHPPLLIPHPPSLTDRHPASSTHLSRTHHSFVRAPTLHLPSLNVPSLSLPFSSPPPPFTWTWAFLLTRIHSNCFTFTV